MLRISQKKIMDTQVDCKESNLFSRGCFGIVGVGRLLYSQTCAVLVLPGKRSS